MGKQIANIPLLELPLNDIIQGNTIIKQKAMVEYMLHHPYQKFLELSVFVYRYFCNTDGSYGIQLGEPIKRKFRAEYGVQYVNCDVNSTDAGKVLCKYSEENIPILQDDGTGTMIPVLDGEGNPTFSLNPVLENVNYMDEWEFYNTLANNVPVVITNLEAAFINSAILENRFNII